MYNEQPAATKAEQAPAISQVYDRIEKALIGAHDEVGAIERKVESLYSTPEDAAKSPSDIRGEPRTFHDRMLKLDEMANALYHRIEKARRNFDKAI